MWLVFECLKHLKAFYRLFLSYFFFSFFFFFFLFENVDEGMETVIDNESNLDWHRVPGIGNIIIKRKKEKKKRFNFRQGLEYSRKQELCEAWLLPACGEVDWDWGSTFGNSAHAARILLCYCWNQIKFYIRSRYDSWQMNKLRTREQKLWRPGTGPAHVRYRFHVVIQRSPLTRSRLSHTHAKEAKMEAERAIRSLDKLS